MIPVLVLSHGGLADELLRAACMIDSHLEGGSAAFCLPWEVDTDRACDELKERLQQLDQGRGVIILTDMFGGTATNLALPFMVPDSIEVVTGVNLPMLVKLASLRQLDLGLRDLAEQLTAAGQKSIRVASEFLRH